MKYSRSLKDYRDWHNTLNHAIEKETAKITRRISAKLRKEMREEGIAIGLETGREEGREEGITIGMETGTKNTQKEIAMRLLDMQMEVEKIAQISDLTIEEILSLKK